MNKVFLIGRLTEDPKCKYTPTGKAILNMTLAIDRPTKGEEKKTDFPRVSVFGATAENCERFLAKGLKVAVEGRIETSSYKKGDETIYSTTVYAERVEFIQFADTKEQEPVPDFKPIDGDIPF